jgi:hypothetical protein
VWGGVLDGVGFRVTRPEKAQLSKPVLLQNDDLTSEVFEEINKTHYCLLTSAKKPPYYVSPRQNLAGYQKSAESVRMEMFFV